MNFNETKKKSKGGKEKENEMRWNTIKKIKLETMGKSERE